MLRINRNESICVYPSWADFSYKWENLDQLLSNPFESGYVDRNKYNWSELGFSQKYDNYRLISGPEGGGLIISDKEEPGNRWLPGLILTKEASNSGAEMVGICPVRYLDPNDGEGWEFGIGKRAKIYSIVSSGEHTEAAGDRVFWAFGIEKQKWPIRGIEHVTRVADHFGVQVKLLSEPPVEVVKETSEWMYEEIRHVWFEVVEPQDDFNYLYAVMMYTGFYVASLSKSRYFPIHVIAQIEGKPGPIKWQAMYERDQED